MADRVAADLHVHSALSPCGGDEMTPPGMLLSAERRGIKVLGVVDHGSARNAPAFVEAAQAFDLRLFVGLEVESAEGVHILALFDTAEAALDMDAVIAGRLPGLPNRPDLFGEQHLVDEWGNRVGTDERLLVTATDLPIERIALLTAQRGGLSIPAHIDRPANGLLPTLGFVPPDLQVELMELSPHVAPAEARARWPELTGRALVRSSDAHFLADIGTATTALSPELAQASLPAAQWGRALAREILRDEA